MAPVSVRAAKQSVTAFVLILALTGRTAEAVVILVPILAIRPARTARASVWYPAISSVTAPAPILTPIAIIAAVAATCARRPPPHAAPAARASTLIFRTILIIAVVAVISVSRSIVAVEVYVRIH